MLLCSRNSRYIIFFGGEKKKNHFLIIPGDRTFERRAGIYNIFGIPVHAAENTPTYKCVYR